mmetsp:Transcript_11957/g.28668  ORF Transcript_11957/g.28668 Transcript_11957/m.28668 type:complete len:173 (+) Transcript_11957:354-872(+)
MDGWGGETPCARAVVAWCERVCVVCGGIFPLSLGVCWCASDVSEKESELHPSIMHSFGIHVHKCVCLSVFLSFGSLAYIRREAAWTYFTAISQSVSRSSTVLSLHTQQTVITNTHTLDHTAERERERAQKCQDRRPSRPVPSARRLSANQPARHPPRHGRHAPHRTALSDRH